MVMAERELAEEAPVDPVEVLGGSSLSGDLGGRLRGWSGRGDVHEPVQPVVRSGLVDAVLPAGVDPPADGPGSVGGA